MIEQPGDRVSPQAANAASRAIVAGVRPAGPPSELLAAEDALYTSGGVDAGAPVMASVEMLLRSKWWIVGLFVLVSAISVPAVWMTVTPTYTARAVLRVAPVVPQIVFKTEDNSILPLYRSYVNTQVSIVNSPQVLNRVLERQDVQRTPWYRQPAEKLLGGAADPLSRLRKDLIVRPRRDTELIDVMIDTKRPADGKIIVDAVSEEYKKYSDDAIRESEIWRLETLARERDSLQKQIDGLMATKYRVASRLGTTDPERLRVELSTQLSLLELQFEALRREQAVAEWDLERMRAEARGESPKPDGEADTEGSEDESAERSRRFVGDPEWRQRNLGLQSTHHQLKLARQRYGDAHPRIAELEATVEHAEFLLREREQQLAEQRVITLAPASLSPAAGLNMPLTIQDQPSLEQQVERLGRQMDLLKADIAAQRAKVVEAGDIATEIAQYDEEIRQKRELYEAVRGRLTAFEMEGKAPARISIASLAILPSEPSQDRRFLLTGMCLACGLMLGVGVAYLRGVLDPRIRRAEDLRRTAQIPFLGQLPPLPATENLMGLCHPAVTEAMRMVRTALLERLNGTAGRVVLITSSTSEAGKTSVAILLARSLAQLGKRTLLVEADLRRPSVSGRLGMEVKRGLVSVLLQQVEDREAIQPTSVPNFDVLVAGEQPESFDTERLANGVFSACLERWRKKYEFVLLDSPPVLPVADARILAGQADGTIMVMRAAHCRRPDVARTYADLTAVGGRIVGTILVGVRDDSGYGYSGGYNYHSGPKALKA